MCEFCPEPPKRALPGGIEILDHPEEALGNGEIRVRALDGKIYVAPVLICHYVVCHQYLPPKEFIAADKADLPPPVLRDGVWRWPSSPAQERLAAFRRRRAAYSWSPDGPI